MKRKCHKCGNNNMRVWALVNHVTGKVKICHVLRKLKRNGRNLIKYSKLND